jgi:hypothetical protein
LEHAATFDFLGKGGNDTFPVQLDTEVFFGLRNDFCDMEWLLSGLEYVVNEVHLRRPTHFSFLDSSRFAAVKELSDDLELGFQEAFLEFRPFFEVHHMLLCIKE